MLFKLNRDFTATYLPIVILVLFAFTMGFYFSGQFSVFETHDNSLITNPAWRMVNGHIPFRDFGLIQGLTPALFEALFIACFGVNLTSLMLHVAIVNVGATLLSYAILLIVGLSRKVALIFAALTAIIFYPPQGLAFSVQHGTLMMMIALLLALLANYRLQSFKTRSGAWFGCGLAMAFAFLSKQTLGLFLPGILMLMLCNDYHRYPSTFLFVIFGGILPFLILLLFAGADIHAVTRMIHYLFILPWEFGGSRLDADLNEALVIYELAITPTIVATIAITFSGNIMFFKNMIARANGEILIYLNHHKTPLVLLGVGVMWLIGNVCLARIHHWDANLLLQSIFLASGVTLAGFLALIGAIEEGTQCNSPKSGPAVVLILCFIALYDGWWAYANIVKHRGIRTVGSVFSTRLDIKDTSLFPEIKNARFREFSFRNITERHITKAFIERDIKLKSQQISFLRTFSETFIILGFPKIIQIFAGKIDPLPVIAIQPGASSTYRDSIAFPKLIADLERNINHFNVKGLIIAKNNFSIHQDYIEAHRKIFCTVEDAEIAAVIRFCAVNYLPTGYGSIIGHVLNLDGPLYK